MRIAVSVLGNLDDDNGTTVRAKRIADLMSGSHEVTIISRGKVQVEGAKSLTVTPENTRLWNLKLIPLMRKHKFDVIYCSSDFFGFISYHLFAPKKTKIVMEAHGIKSLEYLRGHQSPSSNNVLTRFKYHAFRWLERYVMKRADHIVALSKEIEQFYRVYNDRIDIIPVFLNDTVFKERGNSCPRKGNKVIGIIGPFEKGNINNHFLDFIRDNIEDMSADIDVRVIGKIDEEMKFRHARVTYSGYLETMLDYVTELDRLDGVVVPSIAESFGALNKILEPMALGKLVYTTPKGYVGLEGIPQGEAIFVGDEGSLIKLIDDTLFDKVVAERVGRRAKEIIAESYSRSRNMAKILEIIDKL